MMLRIIDRYIITRYLGTFFYTVLIFTMISGIIDFSEKVDDFIKEKVGAWEVITDYYINYLPHLNSTLFPLYALISVIFFTSRLAGNSEIIAILNGGVSFMRMLRPFVIGASIVAVMQLVGVHYLIPLGNKRQVAFEYKYINQTDSDTKTRNIHLFIDSTTKVFIRTFSTYDSTARGFFVEEFKNGELVGRTEAQRAQWNDQKKAWQLHNYSIRTFDGLKETYQTGLLLDTALALTPDRLIRRRNLRYTMTSFELNAFIQGEKASGMGNSKFYEIELHRRTAEPFTVIIVTIMGMAVAARKVRGGVGLHLAVGAGLGGFYFLLTKFSTTFSTNADLPPIIGVWVPNIIYMFIAVYLVKVAQK